MGKEKDGEHKAVFIEEVKDEFFEEWVNVFRGNQDLRLSKGAGSLIESGLSNSYHGSTISHNNTSLDNTSLEPVKFLNKDVPGNSSSVGTESDHDKAIAAELKNILQAMQSFHEFNPNKPYKQFKTELVDRLYQQFSEYKKSSALPLKDKGNSAALLNGYSNLDDKKFRRLASQVVNIIAENVKDKDSIKQNWWNKIISNIKDILVGYNKQKYHDTPAYENDTLKDKVDNIVAEAKKKEAQKVNNSTQQNAREKEQQRGMIHMPRR